MIYQTSFLHWRLTLLRIKILFNIMCQTCEEYSMRETYTSCTLSLCTLISIAVEIGFINCCCLNNFLKRKWSTWDKTAFLLLYTSNLTKRFCLQILKKKQTKTGIAKNSSQSLEGWTCRSEWWTFQSFSIMGLKQRSLQQIP